MSFNLSTLLTRQAQIRPEQAAVIGPSASAQLSYAELDARVSALAAQLSQAGVCDGMNIGLHLPSGVDYIIATYALWRCGACVTPLPVELADEEKRDLFAVIALDALVVGGGATTPFLPRGATPPVPLAGGVALIGLTDSPAPPPQLAACNPAFIRFSSGTTGAAKGVVLSHETIHERIEAANAVLHLGPEDRILWLLSMAYHFAVSIVAYLSYGCGIILPRGAFGGSLVEAACRHRASLVYGAPSHYELMTHDRTERRPALRLAVVTTSPLSAEVARRFQQRFGIALNETYGIIEVGLPAINLSPDPARQGTVGRPLPAYRVRIEQAPGAAIGEVLLHGPGLLDAYYAPWITREELLAHRGGWFATGDLGRIEADGRLTLLGRSKELICVGGMKFFPDEVEQRLTQHPAVAAACVYAAPDPRLGEVPHAQLVLRAEVDNAELTAFCRGGLASYKVPVRFEHVAALRYTASGKLIRRPSPQSPSAQTDE